MQIIPFLLSFLPSNYPHTTTKSQYETGNQKPSKKIRTWIYLGKKKNEKKNDKNIKFKGRNKRELLEKRHYMWETEVPEREQGKRKKNGRKAI